MKEDVHPPAPMEFGSMPLDPVYAWGILLEPVETLIQQTQRFIEQLAREGYRRGEAFEYTSQDDDELERRFLDFFEGLVQEGVLVRLPDAPPEKGRSILGPRRWLRAQRIRANRLIQYWRERGGPDGGPDG